MKIHILGPSGSGKSTCGSALAARYNLPHYDLDDVFWRNETGEYNRRRTQEDRQRILASILAEDNWITEGIYYSWVGSLFGNADFIFYLDAPRWKRIFRMATRFLKKKILGKKGETVASLMELFKWDKTHTAALEGFLKDLKVARPDVVRVSSKKEVFKILEMKTDLASP